jgi:anti-anti-sigma factor
MNTKLIVRNGERAVQKLAIDVPVFVIGRDPSCQYRIESDRVSHRHCRILRHGGRVMIEDLDSTNGTLLNDHFIHTAEVRHGDSLKVGPMRFQVAIATEVDDLDQWMDDCTASRPIHDHCAGDRMLLEPSLVAMARSMPSRLAGRFPSHHGEGDDGRPPTLQAPAGVRPRTAGPDSVPGLGVDLLGEPARGPGAVRLIVEGAGSKVQAIVIDRPRFVIGRDPHCQLRPHNPFVSRMHAAIERRDGRVFVRDLETKIGTMLNDRPLGSEEAEAADGDRLRVGPLDFTIRIGPPTASAPPAPSPAGRTTAVGPVGEGLVNVQHLGYEISQDVLVITILTPNLDDESAVGPIRSELHVLFEQPLPRRVVVSLDQVTYVSRRAVGVLLAHFQRLDRVGGAMRLCHVRPEVMAALEEELHGLTVIDVYPTTDEAVLAAWESDLP